MYNVAAIYMYIGQYLSMYQCHQWADVIQVHVQLNLLGSHAKG